MLVPKRLDNERTTHISFQGLRSGRKRLSDYLPKLWIYPFQPYQYVYGNRLLKRAVPRIEKKKGKG
jgi:hypothetical protein